MRTASAPNLDRFRWRHPRLPRTISVAVCPAEAADGLGLTRLSPADGTGATGLLLALLSEEFAVPTDRIDLHRPSTATAGPGTPIFYTSLSRTPGCIAAAVSRSRIGIDVEQTQTDEQGRALLTLFHPGDQDAAHSAKEGPGWAATMIWTRIEAGLKLRGMGLRRDPATLRVGPGPGPLPLSRVQTLSTGCDRLGRLSASAPEFSVSVAWERRFLRW